MEESIPSKTHREKSLAKFKGYREFYSSKCDLYAVDIVQLGWRRNWAGYHCELKGTISLNGRSHYAHESARIRSRF